MADPTVPGAGSPNNDSREQETEMTSESHQTNRNLGSQGDPTSITAKTSVTSGVDNERQQGTNVTPECQQADKYLPSEVDPQNKAQKTPGTSGVDNEKSKVPPQGKDKRKISKEEIRVFGKVQDLKTTPNTSSRGEITCAVDWKPSISTERLTIDYTLERFRVEWLEKEGRPLQKDVPIRDDEMYKELLNLEPGRIYTVRVIAIYKDREDGSVQESITENSNIDIGITLPLPTVKYSRDQINLSWEKVNGASSYQIHITDANCEELLLHLLEIKENTKQIPIKGNLVYGKRCKITLVVVDVSGRTKRGQPLLETIGGSNLPHNITLQKSEENPRRSLELTWNTEVKPQITTIYLYEVGKSKEVKSVRPSGGSAKFCDLKSSTTYFAKIKARTNNQSIVDCPSDKITTDKALQKKQVADQKLGIRREPHEDPTKAWIKWSAIDIGEGYKTMEYLVKVVQNNLLDKARAVFGSENVLIDETFLPNANVALVSKVKPNSSYKVTVEAKIREIDGEKNITVNEVYDFDGPIHVPKLQGITHEGNYVTFQWDKIPAGTLILEIKEERTEKRLHKKAVHGHSQKLEMVDELRIGRTCEVRLTVDDSKSNGDTKWRKWVIGGDEVPRDVTITKNCNNPSRCVDIHFNEPQGFAKPIKYRIRACPVDGGRSKEVEITKTDYEFKNLRSATTYKFEVTALYRDRKESLASVSELFATDAGVSTISGSQPVNKFDNVGELNLKFEKIQVNQMNNPSNRRVNDVVENAKIVMVNNSNDEEDRVKLKWAPPLFSNNQENYKVDFYEWNMFDGVTKKSMDAGQLDFKERKTAYETREISLELGKSYLFEIRTHYEDIDLDKPNCISGTWKEEFITRPQRPRKVSLQCKDEQLIVKWIQAEGAEHYEVKILQSEDKVLLQSSRKIKEPCVKFAFDDIGIGSDCFAEVTAITKQKKNMAKSEAIIIGGDTVPREAHAETDPDAPTTSAILKWSPPIKPPDSYFVQAIADGPSDSNDIKEQSFKANDNMGRMNALKPGTGYTFKVYAIHRGQRSAGIKTNTIHTRAGPGKVKNVQAKTLVSDPSKSIEITWKKEAKCTEYRIVMEDIKDGGKSEGYTKETSYVFQGLIPRTKYKITVAGGNESGFGNYSDPEYVDTDKGLPSNVRLVHNKKNPQSASLDLLFDGTGETGVGYFVTIFEDAKQIHTAETRNSPFSIGNLTSNKRYCADIRVQYDDSKEKGIAVRSKAIYTAPPPPYNVAAKLKTKDGIALNIIELQWDAQPGCNSHKIIIRRGAQLEAPHIVEGKRTYEYFCPDENSDYGFQVQSKNDSGIFGPRSVEKVVKLAPSKIVQVQASLKEGEKTIEIKWKKPDDKTTSYLVQIFTDDKLQQEEEVFDVQWRFEPDFFKRYQFRVFPRAAGLTAQFSESNLVQSRPKSVRLLSVRPHENSNSTKMRIVWKELKGIADIKYEIEVLSFDLSKRTERIESQLTFANKTSHLHVCESPGGKYAVRIRAKFNDVVGLWSKKQICQLAPIAVEYVMAEIKQRSGKEKYFEITWKPLVIVAHYNVILYSLPEGPDSFRTEVDHKGTEGEGTMKKEISGFPLGRSYRCEVSALSGGLQGQPATSGEVFAGWEKPQHFTTTLNLRDPTHKAQLKWTKPDSVEAFELLISDQSGKKQDKMTLTEPIYNFENGRPGEIYKLTLRWGSKGDFDADSISESFQLAPGPPQKVIADGYLEDGEPRIRVSIDNQYARPDFFDVKVKNKATGKMVHHNPEVVDNELIVHEVLHGEVYIVSVQSVINKLRKSQEVFSSPVQIVPGKINCLDVVEENGLVVVTWPESLPNVDGYVVKWVRGTEDWKSRSLSGERFELPTGGSGEDVRFCVAGENAGGVGVFSDIYSHDTVPSPPTNIRLKLPENDKDTSVVVTYEDDAPDPRKQYGISINGGTTEMIRAREYRATGLTPGETVNVSIYSIVGIKESIAVSATEPIVTLPGKVEKIRAKIAEEHLIFEWDHPFGIAPDHYQVEWGHGDGQYTTVDVNSPRFNISLPNKEACYEIRVAAVNASGHGKFSEWGTSSTPPPPPRNVIAKGSMDEYGRRSMTITFDDDQNTKKEYFIVLTNNKGQKTAEYMTKEFSLTIKGLAPGLSYRAFILTKLGKVKSKIVEATYEQVTKQ